MNHFTASNGLQVILTNAGKTGYTSMDRDAESSSYLGFPEMIAWREFFRAEEDERLGRWRWPENTDFVVYAPRPDFHVIGDVPCDLFIVNERWGSGLAYVDAEFASYDEEDAPFAAAGRAYFDAHPEPKPWATPAAGEIWALDVDLIGHNAYVAGDFSFICADHSIPISDPRITAGRRIWPEVSA